MPDSCNILIVFHNEHSNDKISIPEIYKEKCKVTTVETADEDRYISLFKLRDFLCKYKNTKSSVVFVTQPQNKREVAFFLDCLLFNNTVVAEPSVVVCSGDDLENAVLTACQATAFELGTLIVEKNQVFSAQYYHGSQQENALGKIAHKNVYFKYAKVNEKFRLQVPIEMTSSQFLAVSNNILVWNCDQTLPEDLTKTLEGLVVVWSEKCHISRSLLLLLRKLRKIEKVVVSKNGLLADNFFLQTNETIDNYIELLNDEYERLDPLQAKIKLSFQIAAAKNGL